MLTNFVVYCDHELFIMPIQLSATIIVNEYIVVETFTKHDFSVLQNSVETLFR